MSTTDNTTRTSGSVAIGGPFAASVLAAGVAGSLFLSGYSIYDKSQVTDVRVLYGTGAIEYHDVQPLTRSGSTQFYVAEITNPFSVALSLHRVHVECGNTGKEIPVDIGTRTSTQLSTSGSNIANSHALGTGSLITRGTGGWVIPVGGSTRATTAGIQTTTGASLCALKIWGSERYAP